MPPTLATPPSVTVADAHGNHVAGAVVTFVGSAAAIALAVRVSDEHGNGVPGDTVAFVTTAGGGTTTSRASPVAVSGGIKFTAIVTMLRASCGLSEDGSVYCWGDNGSGELGDGSRTTRHAPALVAGSVSFTELSAGSSHVCGLADAGAVYCWGIASGYGGVGHSVVPVPMDTGQQFVSIAAGGPFYTCGVNASGDAFCWGNNARGALGIGTTIPRSPTPAAVAGNHNFALLSPSCGIAAGGALWCWGAGATGAGSWLDAWSPRAVIRP